MTSEKELRKIVAGYLRDCLDDLGDDAGITRPDDLAALDDHDLDRACALIRTWPIPDLPPSEYEHMTAWVRDGVLIEPVASAGSVHLDWDEEEYPGGPIEPRSLLLTPAQVQAIIAAHYHRKDQE